MRKLIRQLWQDDSGNVLGAEWVFVATILVLGAVTGIVTLRQSHLSDRPAIFRPAPVEVAPADSK
jgi:hypothetical protein